VVGNDGITGVINDLEKRGLCTNGKKENPCTIDGNNKKRKTKKEEKTPSSWWK